MRSGAQRELFEGAPAPPRAVIAPEDKAATRARQNGRCADCGGTSRGGAALDVVRRAGALVALCRRDRLRFDAFDRCRKGVQKRRRRLPRPRPRGQQVFRPPAS